MPSVVAWLRACSRHENNDSTAISINAAQLMHSIAKNAELLMMMDVQQLGTRLMLRCHPTS